MSKNANLARHRATVARTSSIKRISKAVSANAGALGRPAIVVAAASSLMLGISAPANASAEVSPSGAGSSSVQQQSAATVNVPAAADVGFDRAAVTAAPSGAGAHTVQSGDTLGKIAARYAVSLETVFSLNGLGGSSVIYPGDVIKLSGSAAPAVQASAPEPAVQASAPAAAQASTAASVSTSPEAAESRVSLASASITPIASSSGIAGTARANAGAPYVWAGTSPAGWDCSGFVQWVYAQNGIDLPRINQWHAMTPTNNPQPGDVVVQNGGSHVGIYLGGGKMISALNPSQGTLVHDVASMSLVGYYTS